MPLQRDSSRLWLLLMFSTGFCSIVYELALAQLLGGLLGNALARFATTLAVYVAGLGLGSILFTPTDAEKEVRIFIRAELALFVVGLSSPFLFTLVYRLAVMSFAAGASREAVILILTHALIFATGWLSGFELPVLKSLAAKSKKESENSVLVADYAGMFAGSVLFPLLLFPKFGLLAAFFSATALNLIAAIATAVITRSARWNLAVFLAVSFALNTLGFIYSAQLQQGLEVVYVSAT